MVVREKYLDTLGVFGDVEQQVDTALEEFVTKRIIERIKSARAFQNSKPGMLCRTRHSRNVFRLTSNFITR